VTQSSAKVAPRILAEIVLSLVTNMPSPEKSCAKNARSNKYTAKHSTAQTQSASQRIFALSAWKTQGFGVIRVSTQATERTILMPARNAMSRYQTIRGIVPDATTKRRAEKTKRKAITVRTKINTFGKLDRVNDSTRRECTTQAA